MLKGGYQILDFQNKKLTAGKGVIFEGAYDTVDGTLKPILVSGLNFNGNEYRDIFVDFYRCFVRT